MNSGRKNWCYKKENTMRDYSNIPKLEWRDDTATIAKIKVQLMREEPVILTMPAGFDFSLDAAACDCREESGLLTDCRANTALSSLAEQNNIPALQEIGDAADNAVLTVDIDADEGRLILDD